jgi:hypothetical protein
MEEMDLTIGALTGGYMGPNDGSGSGYMGPDNRTMGPNDAGCFPLGGYTGDSQ